MAGWEITVLFVMFSSITAIWEVLVGCLTFLNNILRGRKATWLSRVKEEILGLGIVSLVILFIEPSLESICLKGNRLTYKEKVKLGDKCPKGFHAAFPRALIHASHYLLFYVAVIHIIYSLLTTVMTSKRLKGYSNFERNARGLDMSDEASDGKVDKVLFLDSSKSWRIFTGSLDQDTYTVLRRLCLKRFQAHDIKTRHLNFINICEQCMEAELNHVYSHAWLMILVMALLLMYPRKADQVVWAPIMSTCALGMMLMRLHRVMKKTSSVATIVLDKSKLLNLTGIVPENADHMQDKEELNGNPPSDTSGWMVPRAAEDSLGSAVALHPSVGGNCADNQSSSIHGHHNNLPMQRNAAAYLLTNPTSNCPGHQGGSIAHNTAAGVMGMGNGMHHGMLSQTASPTAVSLRLDANVESKPGELPWGLGSPGSSVLGGFSLHNNALGVLNPLMDHQTMLQLQQQDRMLTGGSGRLGNGAGAGAVALAHSPDLSLPSVWKMASTGEELAGYLAVTPDPRGPVGSTSAATRNTFTQHEGRDAACMPSTAGANGVWSHPGNRDAAQMEHHRSSPASPASSVWASAEDMEIARAQLSARSQHLARIQQGSRMHSMSHDHLQSSTSHSHGTADFHMEDHMLAQISMGSVQQGTSFRQHASLAVDRSPTGSPSSSPPDREREVAGLRPWQEADLKVSMSHRGGETYEQAKLHRSASQVEALQRRLSADSGSGSSSGSGGSVGSDVSASVIRRHVEMKAKKSLHRMLKDLEQTVADQFYWKSPRFMLWIFNLIYIESSLSITIAIALQIPYDKFEKFKEVTHALDIWLPFVFLEVLVTIYLSSVIIPMHAMITTAATSDPLEVIEDIQENKTQSSEEEHGISGLVLGVFNRIFVGKHDGESNLATAFISALAEQSGLVLSRQHDYKAELYHPRVLNVFKELLIAWHGVALYGKPAEPQQFEASLVRFRTAFAELDEDGSGSLSFRELANMIRSLGTFVTEGDIESMLWEVDEDGSHSIGFDEFVKFIMYSFLEEESVSGFGLDVGGLIKASEKMKLQPTEEECDLMMECAGYDEETQTIGPREFFRVLDHIQFGE